MMFPEEMKEAVSALDHDIRWRIVELIEETRGLSYTELLEALGIQKGSLTHHLNRLMEGGIIDNYSEKEFRGPYNSYYRLSRFGKDFLDGLLSSIEFTLFVKPYSKQARLPARAVFNPQKYVDFSEIRGLCVDLELELTQGRTRGDVLSKKLKSDRKYARASPEETKKYVLAR